MVQKSQGQPPGMVLKPCKSWGKLPWDPQLVDAGFLVAIHSTYMDVSFNGGTPKSSILIGFSIINHPFWGTTIFGNPHIFTIKKSTENVGKIFPGTPWIRFLAPQTPRGFFPSPGGRPLSAWQRPMKVSNGAWEVFLGGETSKIFYVHPETWVRILSVNHSKHQEPMVNLGGGFEDFLFPSLPGEMIQFDEHIFQMGWWNHQLVFLCRSDKKQPGFYPFI